MKKFMTIVVAAVALSTVMTSPVRAAKIEIVGFKSFRFREVTKGSLTHIYLNFRLKNNTAKTTAGGVYYLYQKRGKEMVIVKSGKMTALAPGKLEFVNPQLPFEAAEQLFELKVVYENETTSAKTTLEAAKTYLTLISLECVTVNEGDDTPELRVYMPGKEHKIRFKDVNGGMVLKVKGINKAEITRDVRVELWEIDSGSPDDKLGSTIIQRNVLGEKSFKFHHDKEGSYWLKYRVDTE